MIPSLTQRGVATVQVLIRTCVRCGSRQFANHAPSMPLPIIAPPVFPRRQARIDGGRTRFPHLPCSGVRTSEATRWRQGHGGQCFPDLSEWVAEGLPLPALCIGRGLAANMALRQQRRMVTVVRSSDPFIKQSGRPVSCSISIPRDCA